MCTFHWSQIFLKKKEDKICLLMSPRIGVKQKMRLENSSEITQTIDHMYKVLSFVWLFQFCCLKLCSLAGAVA